MNANYCIGTLGSVVWSRRKLPSLAIGATSRLRTDAVQSWQTGQARCATQHIRLDYTVIRQHRIS